MSNFPKPPSVKDKATVTVDEVSYLFKLHLLPQHQRDPNVIGFIKHYLQCRSSKQAAYAMGLTAWDGNNLLRRPDIHTTIKKITEISLMKHGYDAAEVIERVKEIMQIDPAELERPDGSYVTSLKELPPETRRAIKRFKAKNTYETDPNGMKVLSGQIIEVEFWDKMKAVELLGREKNIFKETKVHQHDITKNMSSVLLEAKKRAEDATAEIRDVTQPQIEYGKDES